MNYKSNYEVDKSNGEVDYNDKEHKYWTKDKGLSCVSVTTLIHEFQNFDKEFWLSYKAVEKILGEDFKSIRSILLKNKVFKDSYLDLYNIDPKIFEEEKKIISDEWAAKAKVATDRGLAIHKKFEDAHLVGQTKEIKTLQLGGKFKTDTSNNIQPGKGIYPELLMSRISKDGKLRIAGQADLIIVDGYDVYILDYKGLPLDTPILTTNGFKYLKDISKKDIIFDKNGKETNIKNVSEIHHNDCYEITFDNGESIVADHEHRWLISFRRAKGVYKDIILTTQELVEAVNKYNESKNGYWQPKILNPKPLVINKKDLSIDPYILGAWLGDGTAIAGSITTGENSNLWEEVQKRGYEIGKNISGRVNTQTRTLFGLRTKLSNLNLLENKHIPDEYLLSSYEQRLDLLRGFMDADGYYNKTRKRYVMATTRKYQAEYLRDLLATLGVKPSIIFAKKYCNEKTFDGWDVCFTMKENPFLLRNQIGIEFPKTDKASFRNIKSVLKVETVATKCLEVDSPSHTFLVGRSLIVTHNTNKKIDTSSYFDTKTKKKTTMKYPLSNIEDSNFWHYTLQLSTYAWMIEKINPKFKIEKLMLIHIDHDDKVSEYECEYRKQDVERMLAYYKKQNSYKKFKEERSKTFWDR